MTSVVPMFGKNDLAVGTFVLPLIELGRTIQQSTTSPAHGNGRQGQFWPTGHM